MSKNSNLLVTNSKEIIIELDKKTKKRSKSKNEVFYKVC